MLQQEIIPAGWHKKPSNPGVHITLIPGLVGRILKFLAPDVHISSPRYPNTNVYNDIKDFVDVIMTLNQLALRRKII